jgi:hypothetical protein
MTDAERQMRFLRTVASKPEGATRYDLAFACGREDGARQKCRRHGLVVFEDRGDGKRWHITARGRAALEPY